MNKITLHVQLIFITSSSIKFAFVKVWIHDTELADSSKLTSNPNVWKVEIKKKTQNNKNRCLPKQVEPAFRHLTNKKKSGWS